MVRREILAVQQVASARVPLIHESGILRTPTGDFNWIREQRIDGASLRHVIAGGPLAPEDVVKLALHMLEALSPAEAANIVHRDIKPDNIIRSASGNFFLLDFGIARHLTLTSMTPTISPIGKCTPGYAPPEQFRNRKSEIDSRADLFALGVTLYEGATGTNPFIDGAPNQLEKLRRTETQQLPALNLAVTRSDEMRDFVHIITQKRRDQRLRSVAEALQWMQQIAAANNVR